MKISERPEGYEEKLIMLHIRYLDNSERIRQVNLVYDPTDETDFSSVEDMQRKIQNSLLEAEDVRSFSIWSKCEIYTHKSFAEDFDPASWPAKFDMLQEIADSKEDTDLDKNLDQEPPPPRMPDW